MASTPYEQHWDNIESQRELFRHGDAVALCVYSQDVRKRHPELTDRQIREILRTLATNPLLIDQILTTALDQAVAEVVTPNSD